MSFRQAVLAAGLLTATVVQAQRPSFSFDGSFRTRYESKQDFNFNGGNQTYLLTQLRLDFDYRRNDRSRAFVQLQDARIFGESRTAVPSINDSAVPNVFADQLDIHQAYFEHDFGAATLRAGRQKFNLADSRLVASLEWVNTARVHDGVRLTFGDADSRQVDFFASALVAVDPDDFNDQSRVGSRYLDSKFHGAFVADNSWSGGQLEYWYFYRDNSAFDDSVSTLGARVVRENGSWEFELQGAVQFGDFGGLDHFAYMVHADVERELSSGSWGIAYNLGSGDSDPNDGTHETFDNLFPLNHPYYGYMDLFSLQNVHNIELNYARAVSDRVRLRFGINSFWLNEQNSDAWYSAGLTPLRRATDDADRYVGTELDITASMPIIAGRLVLVGGISRFFGGGYLDDTGFGGDADFFFLQLSYTP